MYQDWEAIPGLPWLKSLIVDDQTLSKPCTRLVIFPYGRL